MFTLKNGSLCNCQLEWELLKYEVRKSTVWYTKHVAQEKRKQKTDLISWGRGSKFCLNNSETLKTVTLAFCSIQKHFIRNVHVKFGILYLPQFPDIGQNSAAGIAGISDCWLSGQSLINGNCHNSRTRDDIDIKIWPVTKHNVKKIWRWDHVGKLWRRCYFSNLVESSRLLDSQRIFYRTYVFINSNHFSYKNRKQK